MGVDFVSILTVRLYQQLPGLKGATLRPNMLEGVPYIDTSISDIGVSQLRKLNATELRKTKKTLVVRDNNVPLAVVLKYEQFLVMQGKLEAAKRTLELLAKRQ